MTGRKETGIYGIRQARPGFFEVSSRLTGEVNEVKVNKGTFIGPCSCASQSNQPWEACSHQTAVRDHLMRRWFRPRQRQDRRDDKSEPRTEPRCTSRVA